MRDERPKDGVLMFERVVVVLGIFVIVACYLIASNIDYSDALTAEATEKEARAVRASEALLTFPLQYDAAVTQSGDGIKEPRTRFYSRKERNGKSESPH